MTDFNWASIKRRGLFVLAIIMTLCAVAALLFGPKYSLIPGLALVLGAIFLKSSRAHSSAIRPAITESESPDRPGPLMWGVGVVLLIALVISHHYFYEDALHGHQQILPVYAFAGIGIVFIVFWAYLLSKMML